MDAALEVEHLEVAFGDRSIIRDLSFQVAKGTTLTVIGPNGAGKTVLFKVLVGALPYRGSFRWAPGTRLGYVPQKLDIDRDMPITGRDFLRARAAVAGLSEAGIPDLLDFVGLAPETLATPFGALSGGQFQRLLMAFALVGQPTALLLDEPMAGVDEPGQKRMSDLIHRLEKDGVTVLEVSHDLSVAYRDADNVLCLGHGGACIGPPRQVLTPEVLAETYGTAVGFHIHHDG